MEHPVPRGWLPASPCTPGCLPASLDDAGVLARLRVTARLAAVVVVLLSAVAVAPVLAAPVRARWLRLCSRAMLWSVGVRLRVTASPWPDGPAAVGLPGMLVVANHVSWIDVLALSAVAPVRLLAKREVGEWPLVGGLARRAGALFVDRARLRALRGTIAALTDALRSGDCVGVFPEGTTWCGAAAGPFRRAAFQAAIDAGAPVRPVAVAFRHADGSPAQTAAFVGAQTLLDSMLRVLRTPGLTCELTVLPPLAPTGDRRDLARRAQEAIARTTGVRHGADPGPVLPSPLAA
ncbi:MAG TPA: lysophospholipid acyltransferase family protein [Pseudonocardia sp.]